MTFAEALIKLWPHGDEKIPGLRAGMIATAPDAFQKYGINSPLLIWHVMAQVSHECGAGHDVVENLSYSAERMTQVWPGRFPTVASAQPFAHNPRALADKVYNGRMGNRPRTDDGYDFRGRGGSQCTGRQGYERLAMTTGLDVVNHPDLILDPQHFMECAVADFIACGCLPYAKVDDIVNVTKRLNGGTIGLSERIQWFGKWKTANPVMGPAPIILPKPVTRPVPPSTPSVTNPAPGSIGATIAKALLAILSLFRKKP